jgi:hypothetical protein
MEPTGTVSMCAEVPEPLFQAALAGFLVQNGVQTREITRCYLANLFPQQSRFSDPIV